MKIKIKYADNSEKIMQVDSTIQEIGEKMFTDKQVETIEILDGGIYETECFVRTPLCIYRVSEEEVKEFDLWNNIRFRFQMQSKIGAFPDYISSCGLCNVA